MQRPAVFAPPGGVGNRFRTDRAGLRACGMRRVRMRGGIGALSGYHGARETVIGAVAEGLPLTPYQGRAGRILPAAALAAIAALMAPAPPAGAASVTSVRIGGDESATRVVIETSAPAAYRAFALRNPPRLVVDVRGARLRLGDAPPGGFVRRVRVGEPEKGVARIVFDVRGGFEIVRKFHLGPGGGLPDRIVVDLARTGPAQGGRRANARTVIVDAGHGGRDPGAVRPGVREKDLNLAAARKLRDILRARGYRVVMTRDSDVYVPLRGRVRIARESKGDLFVSLHADAVANPRTRGLSAYTLSDTASDRLASGLAEHANRSDVIAGIDLEGYDAEVSTVLIDLTRTGTQNESVRFAELLVAGLGADGIRLLRKPHRQAGFAVLKGFDIPSVLIEMGFVSNAADAKRLSGADYRRRLMTAVADHIDRYFAVRIARGY